MAKPGFEKNLHYQEIWVNLNPYFVIKTYFNKFLVQILIYIIENIQTITIID